LSANTTLIDDTLGLRWTAHDTSTAEYALAHQLWNLVSRRVFMLPWLQWCVLWLYIFPDSLELQAVALPSGGGPKLWNRMATSDEHMVQRHTSASQAEALCLIPNVSISLGCAPGLCAYPSLCPGFRVGPFEFITELRDDPKGKPAAV